MMQPKSSAAPHNLRVLPSGQPWDLPCHALDGGASRPCRERVPVPGRRLVDFSRCVFFPIKWGKTVGPGGGEEAARSAA